MQITKVKEGGFGREDMNEIALKVNQLIVEVNGLLAKIPLGPTTSLITSFSIGSNVGVIAGTNILVTVPAGTVVTALVPTIVTAPLSTVSPSSLVPQNFTSPQTYVVTAKDKTITTYTVTVVVA
jgi:hypothetical protein